MITSPDVHEEMKKAEKFMDNCKDSFHRLVIKLLTVILKVNMSTRLNTILIMAKLGIKKIEPKRQLENKKEK
jgi:hypothetical protein